MKYNFKKYWLLIAILPFAIMILLHIGIVINKLTNINFNIPNISAADWFVFAGSYLGGVITLGGVILTIKHERTINLKQVRLSEVLQEKEKLGEILSKINLYAPGAYYQEYSTMKEIQNSDENLSSIRKALVEEKGILSSLRNEFIFSTNIWISSPSCDESKQKRELDIICHEIVELYNKINFLLFNTYEIFDNLILLYQSSENCRKIIIEKQNSHCDVNEDNKKFQKINENVLNTHTELMQQFDTIKNMRYNEYDKLITLCKKYIEIKINNIRKLQ